MAEGRFAAFEAFLKTAATETDGHRVTLQRAGANGPEQWVVTHYDELGLFVRQVGQMMNTRFIPWSSIQDIY